MSKTAVTALGTVVVLAVTAAIATSVGSAGTTRTAQQSKNCAFTLRIGDVLPFTGGLAAYGANLDRAVKVGVGLQNAGLKQAGLAKKIRVESIEERGWGWKTCLFR